MISPVIPTSATIASSIALRVRYLAERIHSLGPRPTFELLCELVGGAPVMPRLETYAAIDRDVVRELGGAEIPSQLIVLKGGRP
jgi:hypothetical protein